MLRGDLFGNVLSGSYEEVHGTVRATYRRHSDTRPDDRVVGTDEPFLKPVIWRLVGGQPRRQFQAAWQIVGKRELLEGAGEEVGALAAENLA
jgi:hypothetical protein